MLMYCHTMVKPQQNLGEKRWHSPHMPATLRHQHIAAAQPELPPYGAAGARQLASAGATLLLYCSSRAAAPPQESHVWRGDFSRPQQNWKSCIKVISGLNGIR